MKQLITDKEKTVIICAHNRMILEELCERVLWMEKGKIVKIGNVKEVMDEYEEYMHQ